MAVFLGPKILRAIWRLLALSRSWGNFMILYFFDYKTEFFTFQNDPKDLDPSCKTDLDLWDCLGRVNLVL